VWNDVRRSLDRDNRELGGTGRQSLLRVQDANLSCAGVKARVNRLSRTEPKQLIRVSFTVSTGERLSCLYVHPAKDIRSLRPRTAWGWCGTDVDRVPRFGFVAAADTEFFWVTADKRRRY
jgi:hypothetical protein